MSSAWGMRVCVVVLFNTVVTSGAYAQVVPQLDPAVVNGESAAIALSVRAFLLDSAINPRYLSSLPDLPPTMTGFSGKLSADAGLTLLRPRRQLHGATGELHRVSATSEEIPGRHLPGEKTLCTC